MILRTCCFLLKIVSDSGLAPAMALVVYVAFSEEDAAYVDASRRVGRNLYGGGDYVPLKITPTMAIQAHPDAPTHVLNVVMTAEQVAKSTATSPT